MATQAPMLALEVTDDFGAHVGLLDMPIHSMNLNFRFWLDGMIEDISADHSIHGGECPESSLAHFGMI